MGTDDKGFEFKPIQRDIKHFFGKGRELAGKEPIIVDEAIAEAVLDKFRIILST